MSLHNQGTHNEHKSYVLKVEHVLVFSGNMHIYKENAKYRERIMSIHHGGTYKEHISYVHKMVEKHQKICF